MSSAHNKTLVEAENMLSRGDTSGALSRLWSLVSRAYIVDGEFRTYLRTMAKAYEQEGAARAVATVHLFLGDPQSARRVLSQHEVSTEKAKAEILSDLARVCIFENNPAQAARHYQDAGMLAHAAIQLENAGSDRAARVLWQRLADSKDLREEPYTQGLVRFNLGRACDRLGDTTAGRKAYVQSIHLLEAAADGFETLGLRERAFDCFQILLALGKDGAFENLAEGYLNCIRILKEDGLKYYVLQYYEDFQALALEHGELHAAATLFREAAQFCRANNLPYDRHYRMRAAETHVASAEALLADSGRVMMAENAYAAAIDAFNDLGAYSRVREVYGALAELDLGERRQARYRKLQARLSNVPDDRTELVSLPDYLRKESGAYPEIWKLDVIEWEQHGDAAQTLAEVLQDDKWQDFLRRRALLCRLYQLGHESDLIGLCEHLGRVEIYAALAPLEKFAEHTDPAVRAAAHRAVRQLFYKRSFVAVRKGLSDPDEGVRQEALASVSALHFGHAFDPLIRIYRESTDIAVRHEALTSIGKIASQEATEALIDVLRNNDPEEQELVKRLLVRADHPQVTSLLKSAAALESGKTQQVIQSVLRSRA